MFWKVMKYLPMTALALIVYNIVAFSASIADMEQFFLAPRFTIPMMSGAEWTVSWGHVMVFFALVLLFFEIVKATKTTAAALVDHALSTLIFIGFLIEFLLVKEAGTSTFFLLMVISLIDVVGGYIIGIRVARRDLALGPGL